MAKLIFSFFVITGVLFSSSFVWAGPLDKIFGNGPQGYHQMINERFLQFYQKNFYDFSQKLNPEEKEYLQFCLENIQSWGKKAAGNFPLPYIRVGVGISGDKISYDRLALAPELKRSAGYEKLLKVLKGRGIVPPPELKVENYFWVEWDFSKNLLSLYLFEEDQGFKKIDYQNKQKKGEASFKAFSQKELDARFPFFSDFFVGSVKSDHGEIWVELTSFDSRLLNAKVRQPLFQILNETGFMADSLEYHSSDKAVVFYP